MGAIGASENTSYNLEGYNQFFYKKLSQKHSKEFMCMECRDMIDNFYARFATYITSAVMEPYYRERCVWSKTPLLFDVYNSDLSYEEMFRPAREQFLKETKREQLKMCKK